MKLLSRIFIATVIIVSVGFAHTSSKLLAPVYPGSVVSPLRSDKTQSVYLSKKPIKKVESFYNAKIGKLSSKDPITESYFLEDLGNTPVVAYGKTILTANQISRQEGYPDPDAKDAGVLLLAKTSAEKTDGSSAPETANIPSVNSGSVDSMQAKLEQMQKQIMKSMGKQNYSKADETAGEMSNLFDGLKNEVYMQHHSQKELIAVYNKYKFLEVSFFPLVKDKQDGPVSYARHLLRQYKNKLGNTDAMSDHWNYWIGFLKKLASNAYKTCIVINTKPAEWHK